MVNNTTAETGSTNSLENPEVCVEDQSTGKMGKGGLEEGICVHPIGESYTYHSHDRMCCLSSVHYEKNRTLNSVKID